MNPHTPGTFWWARQEYISGHNVKDESGYRYPVSGEDPELRRARWDTIFRFTVAEFESGGWMLY